VIFGYRWNLVNIADYILESGIIQFGILRLEVAIEVSYNGYCIFNTARMTILAREIVDFSQPYESTIALFIYLPHNGYLVPFLHVVLLIDADAIGPE
jgi:hypothetical protein